MRIRAVPAAWAVLALSALPGTTARAAPLEAGGTCGGDAYSSGIVVEGRPARKGPLVAVPDTLCPDLAAPNPPVRVEIYGVPGLSGDSRRESGADPSAAPYGDRFRRGTRVPPLSSD